MSDYVIGKTEPITNHYTLGKAIGTPGQFGAARLCTENKTGTEYAVKIMSKARFTRLCTKDHDYFMDQMRGEIDVMRKLKHPNIIRMHDVFEDRTNLCIVMECCYGGELFDRIKSRGHYSERRAANVIKMIAEGVAYMHSKGVAHCDLKAENFLFLNDSDDSPIKIIDFGMVKYVKRRKYFKHLCGTPYYVAPEVLNAKYSEHCDLWSIGVVLFVMLFGYPPFYADPAKYGTRTTEVIFQKVATGFDNVVKKGYGSWFPQKMPVSDDVRDLIGKLLDSDTATRLTAVEVLEHPWLTTATDTPLVQAVLKNLSTFHGQSKLELAVLSMLSDQMTEAEMKELQESFKKIDTNNDGTITVAELEAAMSTMDPGNKSMAKVQEMMRQADVNKDGVLSYKEMLMTAVNRKLMNKEERLYNVFTKMDLNGDGRIDREELTKLLKCDNAVDSMIQEADKDGDGMVDYNEFIDLWTKKGIQKAKRELSVKKSAAVAVN